MLDPGNAVAFLDRGKANADKANLDAAISDDDKAIALDPAWALAYNNRGFTRTQRCRSLRESRISTACIKNGCRGCPRP